MKKKFAKKECSLSYECVYFWTRSCWGTYSYIFFPVEMFQFQKAILMDKPVLMSIKIDQTMFLEERCV